MRKTIAGLALAVSLGLVSDAGAGIKHLTMPRAKQAIIGSWQRAGFGTVLLGHCHRRTVIRIECADKIAVSITGAATQGWLLNRDTATLHRGRVIVVPLGA